jgi:hypothetical protein
VVEEVEVVAWVMSVVRLAGSVFVSEDEDILYEGVPFCNISQLQTVYFE